MNRRVVSQAATAAISVRAGGGREVLGLAVGGSKDGAFRTAFLRSREVGRFGGAQLVVSAAHTGLKQALAAVSHRQP